MNGLKLAAVAVIQWLCFSAMGLIVYVLVLFGRIQLRRSARANAFMRQGGVLVCANHPSLIEPFILAGIFMPAFVFNMKRCPWSVPDKNFFRRSIHWLTEPCLRHIPLQRGNTVSGVGVSKAIIKKLQAHENIIIHPEGGRTCKGTTFNGDNRRQLRTITSSAAACAVVGRAKVLPVWIDFPVSAPESMRASFFRLLFQQKMIVHFGRPYLPSRRQSQTQLNQTLAEKILSA
jgi:1-acyl-sn-glycerol-3-phosphate acyltransferase